VSPKSAADCGALVRARAAPPEAAGCLVLDVPQGARVSVDGVAADADAPPLTTVTPIGPRQVEVGANGHQPWRGLVRVDPSSVQRFSPPLEETPQRIASYGLLGLAGASAATAIALGVVSVVRARQAEDQSRFQSFDLGEYGRLRDLADQFRIGSGIAGGGALVSFVLGVSLFAFDEPALGAVGAPELAWRAAASDDGALFQVGGSF
jgi:hypothetical protein